MTKLRKQAKGHPYGKAGNLRHACTFQPEQHAYIANMAEKLGWTFSQTMRHITHSHQFNFENDAMGEEKTLLVEINAELSKARGQFPGKNVTFAALIEEVGELATAVFEESSANVRKEAIQVATMAMRIVLDGDHCFDQWRANHGLDPLVAEEKS